MSLTSSIYLQFTFQPNIWFLICKQKLSNLLFSGNIFCKYVSCFFCHSVCLVVSISKVPKWNIHIWNFVQRHPQKSFDVFKFNAGQSSPDNLWVAFSLYFNRYFNSLDLKKAEKYKLSCLHLTYFMIGCGRIFWDWRSRFPCVFHIYLDTNTNANIKPWK